MAVINLADALADLMESLGLTGADLAGAFGVDQRTIERWRANAAYPQQRGRQRLVNLLALRDQLYATFTTAAAVRSWMQAPNHYLSGLTPTEVARAGRVDRVEAALEALASGVFV